MLSRTSHLYQLEVSPSSHANMYIPFLQVTFGITRSGCYKCDSDLRVKVNQEEGHVMKVNLLSSSYYYKFFLLSRIIPIIAGSSYCPNFSIYF